MDVVRKYTKSDETIQEVMKCVLDQDWHKADKSVSSQFIDDLSMRGDRIILSSALQEREALWWSGMDRIVEHIVQNCLPCQATTPLHNREP